MKKWEQEKEEEPWEDESKQMRHKAENKMSFLSTSAPLTEAIINAADKALRKALSQKKQQQLRLCMWLPLVGLVLCESTYIYLNNYENFIQQIKQIIKLAPMGFKTNYKEKKYHTENAVCSPPTVFMITWTTTGKSH